jgi:hypothetical protein
MPGTQMKAKKGGAHSPTTGIKGPRSGRPETPTNVATHGNDGAVKFPGAIDQAVDKPANDKNLYQEGNMALSAPNTRHRPESAVSEQLPGGTTTSGDTQ